MNFMLQQLNIPHPGVLCKASENICIVPKNLPSKIITIIKKTLEVEVISTSICSTSLIGALIALNSSGALVTEFAYSRELEKLKKALKLTTVSDRLNAIGNNVLVNDKHALVHPQLSRSTCETIESTLEVEVAKGTIAGLKTVGSAGVVTNKGLLLHPKTSKEELKFVQDFFKLPAKLGTVNFGLAYLGAGLVANSKGAIVGASTTGIELGRIEEALGLG